MLPGQQFTPESILAILWRRKYVVLLPFLVVLGAGAAYIATIPDQYQSETLILVVPQRVPESYVRSTVTAPIEDRLRSIQQQIFSRSRLERVVLDFGLYEAERQSEVMEDIVARMRNDVEVVIERGDAFRIRYASGDPRLAQRVTERLASMFIEENLRDREVLAEGTNQFLEAQLEDARQRLIEQEKKLELYQRQHSGALPSQVQSNLQAIATMQIQLQALGESLRQDRDRRLVLERQLADVQTADLSEPALAPREPGDAAGPPAPTALDRLDTLTTQLRALELRYRPEHPDIIAARRLIRDLEAQAAMETAAPAPDAPPRAAPPNPRLAARRTLLAQVREDIRNIDVIIQRKEEDEKRLSGLLAGYQGRVDSAPTREAELTELTRDYATLQAMYSSLLTKREDSKIAANLERRQIGEQFKVLDPARVAERPHSPNRARLNTVAGAGGLFLGLALAALLEYRDRTMRTAVEAARVLNLPVLGVLAAMAPPPERRRRRRRQWLAAAGTVLLASCGAIAYLVWTQRLS